jgi:hypothetical protein
MENDRPIAILKATGEGLSFSREERERHIYIVGKSGSGKSTTLYNLAMGDILAGEGVAIVDPHGDLAEAVADCIPHERTNQVCYFNVADTERPVGFNPIAGVRRERQALAAAGIVSAFKALWADSWGPRTEHLLYHGVASLIEAGRSTLIDLPRVYAEEAFRSRVIGRVRDPITRRFWEEEFSSYDQRFRTEAVAPILNKTGQFAASPNVRLILGQVAPKFDLAYAMNHRQIVIANLAKGQIGEQAANLLGSLLVSHLQLAAMERSALPEHKRVPFFAHIDEFQSFSTDSFASLLSEARKFRAHFCLANQYTSQLTPAVRAAVFGNAGSMIVFRVGSEDAALLAPEFHPFQSSALADQGPFEAWVRRGDSGRHPVIASPSLYPPCGSRERVLAQSRRNFGRPRGQVEHDNLVS